MIHHIYEEMRTKYGFSSGGAVPEGVEVVRKKIISLINKGLPADSVIEAYPVDRPGIHNYYLIGYRNKDTKKNSGEPYADVIRILIDAERNGWSIETRITMIQEGS